MTIKRTIYSLLLLLMLFVGCKKEPVGYAVFSGQIKNAPEDFVMVISDSKSNHIPFNPDGSFRDTIRSDFGNFYLMLKGQQLPIHLEKGNEININANANDLLNTVVFSGEGTQFSEYFLTKEKTKLKMQGDSKLLYALDELDFKRKNTKIRERLVKVLDSMIDDNEGFKQVERRHLNYEYLFALNYYEKGHTMVINDSDFKVSDEFLDELKDMDLNNEEDYHSSIFYPVLVRNKYRNEAEKLTKSDSISFDIAYLTVLSQIPNEVIKNDLLFKAVKSEVPSINDLDKYYGIFKAASTDEENNIKAEEIYLERKKTSKGYPSPKFVDYQNYNGGTTSLDDFKGKYVYIDVWGTGCLPCYAEIPHLNKLEIKYEGKNITFVSISVNAKRATDLWRKTIEDKGMTGIQLLADDGMKSEFLKKYAVNAIPRFILIDPEGNIVDPNAPRPSEPALVKLFSQLKL
ncbi:TlpA disulfide reductase family protein [uncultured Lutibacter sp.]|uniref:TlpA family protein disulfide reductase n=1 Tax=uncultured Lutibacter sp. TaxID=437739 RepID=UPI0026313CDA|nr:TlpA disulfide reductase family protein [uncultured Lutibacter sp.]